LEPASAQEVVDASGMVVAPGFIDIQSHSIYPLMIDGRCLSKIKQGVTTEIMGESRTPAPVGGKVAEDVEKAYDRPQLEEWGRRAQEWHHFRDWLDALAERGVSPNIGSYLGGGTLRLYVKGLDGGRSTAAELDTMRTVMREAMEGGAFGVSYALIYPPDAFVDTDELVEACKVVGEYGGSYITHIRSEAGRFLESLDEAIEIGRRANVPVEIYHLKAAGKTNWAKMDRAIERINEARAEGLDITADMYPYVFAGTGLASVLPPDVAEGGKFFEKLSDPAERARIREEALHPSGDWEAMAAEAGPEGVIPVGFRKPENQQYVGKSLAEIAVIRGQDWADAAIDLLLAERDRIGTLYVLMDEANLRWQLQQPWIKISTDAGGVDPEWAREFGPTHPRAYGTYTRVLGKYVREEGVISLEDAIRKMSSAVADRLGLRDRSMLRRGCFADVIVFDPETVGDRATITDSHQLSVGIRDVWVNGVRVLESGDHTGAMPGRIVNGPGYRAPGGSV
ncbi:MAG: amidohydrolase family protein, partial [Chloroflexota bacterium]|nr:amidohydrolase family protein [Chloroflexota bacterium]